jgi:hypothetical protein
MLGSFTLGDMGAMTVCLGLQGWDLGRGWGGVGGAAQGVGGVRAIQARGCTYMLTNINVHCAYTYTCSYTYIYINIIYIYMWS